MFVKNITETTQKIRIDWVETEIGAWEVFQTTESKAEELVRNYPSIIGYASIEGISWSGEISDLDDVEITNPTDWQILGFDETSEKWKNKEIKDTKALNYWKKIAMFWGSVCYNAMNNVTIKQKFADAIGCGTTDIKNYAVGGAWWCNGTKISTQLDTCLNDADFTADVFVFWNSTNDYTHKSPIGTLKASSDTNTVIGAMCNVVNTLRTAKPTATILFVTPIRTFAAESWYLPEYYAAGTDTIWFVRYRDAVMKVAWFYWIPTYDLWNNSWIDIKNYTNYMSDYIHPTQAWYQLFINDLWKFVLNGKGDTVYQKTSNIYFSQADFWTRLIKANTDYFGYADEFFVQIKDGVAYVNWRIKVLQSTGRNGKKFTNIFWEADNVVNNWKISAFNQAQATLVSRELDGDGNFWLAYAYMEPNGNLMICTPTTLASDSWFWNYRIWFSIPVRY